VLGIPEGDFPRIKAWGMGLRTAGEKTVTPEVSARGDEAARGLTAYFSELAEARRADLRDDLLSSLLVAESDGDTLTRTELVANLVLLLQAGHETTQDLLGNAQVALFRHPDQLTLLRERPELTKNAVEEFLRYDASVQISHRVVLDGTRLDGVEIPERAMVYTLKRGRQPRSRPVPRARPPQHRSGYPSPPGVLLRRVLLPGGRSRAPRDSRRSSGLDRPVPHPAAGDRVVRVRDTLQLRGPQALAVAW